MTTEKLPKHFQKMMDRYEKVIEAMNGVGDAVRDAGPLEEKTAHLLQLAAAASQRSEGAVHSHTRRAVRSGATPDEIRHALVVLIPTIGYPTVAAALSWADDILEG